MQTQADIMGTPVKRPKCIETTAMGAAYLAGLAVGYWKNREEVEENWAVDKIFSPSISEEERQQKSKDGIKRSAVLIFGRKKIRGYSHVRSAQNRPIIRRFIRRYKQIDRTR